MPLKRQQVVIAPSRGWVPLNLSALHEYRELLYFLIWRDIKVRYKQTAFGVAWAIIQPFMTMVVFSIFLGHLAKMPSDGVPYPLFAFSALLPWQLFAQSITDASNSLVSSQNLITKVYFPRLVVPLAPVVAGLVDFGIAFVVLLAMMIYYRVAPSWQIVFLPIFTLLAVFTALALSLWLSALNIQYRDVRYTLPFLTQFWLFATPVAYPSGIVPGAWRVIYGLNPMAGVVEGFRWAILGTQPPGALLLVSTVAVLALLIGGLYYFRRVERIFADIV